MNAIFVGQRLGLCWTMIENLCPEYKNQVSASQWVVFWQDLKCRDPYMVIAEKAAGPTVRHIVSFCISITLFGVACVVIVLLGSFFENIFQTFHLHLSHCVWMVILTALLTPICWLGTPKDFWYENSLKIFDKKWRLRFVAVLALTTTVIGCVMIIIKEGKIVRG